MLGHVKHRGRIAEVHSSLAGSYTSPLCQSILRFHTACVSRRSTRAHTAVVCPSCAFYNRESSSRQSSAITAICRHARLALVRQAHSGRLVRYKRRRATRASASEQCLASYDPHPRFLFWLNCHARKTVRTEEGPWLGTHAQYLAQSSFLHEGRPPTEAILRPALSPQAIKAPPP